MNDTHQHKTFVLLDAGMIGGVSTYITGAPDRFPSWLTPVYKDDAAEFGPLVIDMELADQAGDGKVLQEMLCAMIPRLHFSLIDTELTQEVLTEHLRQFIFFSTEDSEHYVLRFADCRVLPALATTLTPEQWATLTRLLSRWQIRGRDGKLVDLPLTDVTAEAVTPPLIFSDAQIEALSDATEPDQMIFNIKTTYPTQNFLGSAADHYQWAKQSIVLWKNAGCTDRAQLLDFVVRVFHSLGALLNDPQLSVILAHQAVKQSSK
ncbi:DUF4123 domain-containing protein [Collimonas sp. NPDC087041]|uniref:DUF4123 domain-containing protein n=1 Tax=Collimonas sp. NPDC087041 TaxID=3363960 RepID=UPI0037FC92EA